MSTCATNKIDSNVSGLSFAEEICLKQLPTTPIWYGQEPNTFSDFGGELTSVVRAPIDSSRQRKKGTISDLDASGGFNSDFTKTNLARILQGFFFADMREKFSTAPYNGTAITITSVDATNIQYEAAFGLDAFVSGDLLYASGFGVSGNNGLKKVSDSASGNVIVWGSLSDETPPAGVSLTKVGVELASDDAVFAVTSGIPSLTTTTKNLTTLGLIPGEWVFLGGDDAATQLGTNVGYARVKSVSANAIVFDDTTFSPVADAGTGKTLRIFFGNVIRNEKDAALIKRRSYNVERTLGNDDDGTQSEYLEGAVANEFTLNFGQADKLNADLTFVACDATYRSGATGLKTGTRISAPGEDAYNTSSDIYRIKMAVIDPATSNPTSLFGYVSEGNVSINNNVSPSKAVGVLGAFDTSAGDFEVGGSLTVYFTSIAAVQAVRNNADVGFSMIGASKNAGFVFDIPLLGLGGGRLNVEKDSPITVPLEPSGAENANGYTMLCQFFSYLPNIAMPQ